jgi:PAS domain S-box-containing protein
MAMPRWTISLRTKIVLLVGGTTFLAAALVGGVNAYQIRRAAVEKAIEKLSHDANLTALTIRNAYDEVKSDALIMIRAPAVQGFIRARRNAGMDARDNSSEAEWQGRLNLFFTSMMGARPQYTAIRYIGLDDDGREIVRIERQADGRITAASQKELREASSEAYFRDVSAKPRDSAHYTTLTYEREIGGAEASFIPTVHGVIPVFGAGDDRFGMLAISVNYEAFLARAVRHDPVMETVYVSDVYGNYFERSADGKIFTRPANDKDAKSISKVIKSAISSDRNSFNFSHSDYIWYFSRENIIPSDSRYLIHIFIAAPASHVLAEANALARSNIVVGLVIVILASLAAGVFGNWLVSPISRMTGQVNAFREGSAKALDLPTDRQDEAGKLARAFHDLVAQLDQSNQSRTKLSLQLNEFIANSVDGVVIIDERGIIEEVNPACLTLVGYERDELVGQNVSVLMPEAVRTQHDGYIRAYLETGVRRIIGSIRDEQAQRKDGGIFPIALSISELRLPDRRIFTALIRDMTAIHAIQEQLETHAAELERSNRDLNQFAYVASHDLKAPLRVINNASRWLEEDLAGKLTEDDQENMALLRNRVRRMEKLLDDLLEYARIGKAGDERYNEIIDGDGMIADVLALLALPKSFEVSVSSTFAAIKVNRMPLQQIFFNLLGNAIKHHDRKHGLIEIGAEEIQGRFCFTVRDDGPGIPARFHDEIFEMFHTLKPRDQVEGSGMGLAMVRRHVEHLGGTINVKSGDGRGAEFIFTWPKPVTQSVKAA